MDLRALCGNSFPAAFLDHRLQAMQEICRALRLGGSAEDRPFVVLQDFQPTLDVSGMVGTWLGRQFQIGTKERRSKFRDQLFASIAFIAPFLAPELTIKTALVLRPMGLLPISA